MFHTLRTKYALGACIQSVAGESECIGSFELLYPVQWVLVAVACSGLGSVSNMVDIVLCCCWAEGGWSLPCMWFHSCACLAEATNVLRSIFHGTTRFKCYIQYTGASVVMNTATVNENVSLGTLGIVLIDCSCSPRSDP
jgi:hypothetical protein